MPLTLRSEATQSFIDYSGERSSTKFYIEPLLADGSNRAQVQNSFELVQAAIAALTLCNFGNARLIHGEEQSTPNLPADVHAQREIGLLVRYTDLVTRKSYNMTIPGPDLTLVAQVATDEIDIANNVAALAFIAVFEAECVSVDGNSVEVTGMRIVGRSN